jgi:hypothetical protein
VFTKLQQLPGRSAPRFFGQKHAKLRTSDTEEGAARLELLTNVGRSLYVRESPFHLLKSHQIQSGQASEGSFLVFLLIRNVAR